MILAIHFLMLDCDMYADNTVIVLLLDTDSLRPAVITAGKACLLLLIIILDACYLSEMTYV